MSKLQSTDIRMGTVLARRIEDCAGGQTLFSPGGVKCLFGTWSCRPRTYLIWEIGGRFHSFAGEILGENDSMSAIDLDNPDFSVMGDVVQI